MARLRDIVRSARTLDQRLQGVNVALQDATSVLDGLSTQVGETVWRLDDLERHVAELRAGSTPGQQADREVQAAILANLVQYHRDGWEASERRHQFVVALLEGLRSALQTSHDPPSSDRMPGRDQWFWDHYEQAASEIVSFLADEGFAVEDRDVVDIGCGDGIIDLGVMAQGRPRSLIGFDIKPTVIDELMMAASGEGIGNELPSGLSFETCEPDRIPAADGSCDVVISWSAFEHIAEPLVVAREIRRILRADGALFVQLWPFFASEYGSHLDNWFPDGYDWIEGFHHLTHTSDELEHQLRTRESADPELEKKLDEFRTLNRVTLDELQDALSIAGFNIRKVKLLSHTIRLPVGLARCHRLTDLAIGGIELLATPDSSTRVGDQDGVT